MINNWGQETNPVCRSKINRLVKVGTML